MNVINASLLAVGVRPAQYPPADCPEVAFAGRSNVGKSSLINCMMNRKALARTSSTPGKTRTLNFYDIDGRLRFVDLPGYGYAKTTRSQSQSWGPMIEGYLLKRDTLKCVILLVDIRHRPTENDRMLLDWFRAHGMNAIIVATKMDKINRSQLGGRLADVRRALDLGPDESVVAFSSATKAGKDELWALIEANIQT